MTDSRVSRGRKAQELVAARLRWLYPRAASTPASLPGRDIRHTPKLALEVKATERVDMTGWLRQATAYAGADLPAVVYQPRGYGPKRIAEWPVIIRLDDFIRLLEAASYGGTA